MRFQRIHGALDHGTVQGHGRTVQRKAFLEQRCGIHNHVGLIHQINGVGIGHVFADTNDFNVGIQIAKAADNVFNSRLAEVIMRLQQLPVQIAGAQNAAMGKDKPANTSGTSTR